MVTHKHSSQYWAQWVELVPEENDYKLAQGIHCLPGGYQGLLGHPPAAQADSLQVTAQATILPKPEDPIPMDPRMLWYRTGFQSFLT